MNRFFQLASVILIAAVVLVSCKKDEDDPIVTPSISDVTAVNHDDDSSEVPLGGTISVDFEAVTQSDAKLDFYHIEIHDHPASGLVQDEYKIIDEDFKDLSTFKGLINAHVHQHIQVPDTANLGSYHVVVIVVDEDGNSADTEELETHITVVNP